MNKQDIDKQAEREGNALRKQGRSNENRRTKIRDNYNTAAFDRLFKK